jgi:TIR domain
MASLVALVGGARSRPPFKIFVSYRRGDATGHVGRLVDYLTKEFGPDSVFFDVDSIKPGETFPDAIRDSIASSRVLLAVIGPDWLTAAGPDGRRLDGPDDFVRAEIRMALEQGVSVLPVLVHGARPPREKDLPADIARLSSLNAIQLADSHWAYDTTKLYEALERLSRPRKSSALRGVALLAVGLASLIIAAIFIPRPPSGNRVERCWEQPFEEIPSEMTATIEESLPTFYPVVMDQAKDGLGAVRLAEGDKRLGAILFRVSPDGASFRILRGVRPDCGTFSSYENVSHPGEGPVMVNWDELRVMFEGRAYHLRLGSRDGKILADLKKQ